MTRRARELSYTKAQRLNDPYVVAGRRTYVIGAQDGRFPDMGGHVPHEMGGMWSHPIKVLDGFWLGLGTDPAAASWLAPAERFETSPVAARHIYPRVLDLEIARETWVPHDEEALVITWEFRGNPAERACRTLPIVVLFRTDLQGVWLSERLGWRDGTDQARLLEEELPGQAAGKHIGGKATAALKAAGLVHAWDSEMPFHAVVGPVSGEGATIRRIDISHDLWGPEKTHGQGVSIAYCVDLPFDSHGRASITFVVTSSSESFEGAWWAWQRVAPRTAELRAQKERFMDEILSLSRLQVADPEIQGLFDDVKVGYEQLYRHVASFGEGLGAGLPEYPWWFGCDNSYALLGALCVGRFEMTLETLRLLARVSEETNGDGRIIHEVTTNGVVYNPGNSQETPHFVMAVWEAFLWTGDMEFLRELYPVCRKGVLEWLLNTQDTDGDLFPEGYGITEVAGLNWELIDTAVYAQRALAALAEMAKLLEDSQTAAKAGELASRLAQAIEERYWLEDEGLYADLIASPKIVLERLAQIRGQESYQSPAMSRRLDEIERICRESDPAAELPWLFKTWVIFCPIEVGLASKERAERALRRMESSEFTGLFGVYLSGYNQNHMMTISTGVAAVCEARYHRMDAALGYLRQIAATRFLRFPGAPSEMSPADGCFVQAWTGYGALAPIVRHFFGLEPAAHAKRVKLSPHLPTSWNAARLDAVRIGKESADIAVTVDKELGEVRLEIAGLSEDWTIEVELDPAWYGLPPGAYALELNGETIAAAGQGDGEFLYASWQSKPQNAVVLKKAGA